MNSSENPWLVRRAPRPGAQITLFCFPFAGGGAAAFHVLIELLPPQVDPVCVVLPGRERRLAEEPIDRMGPLTDALFEAVSGELTPPFAFVGHSLGSLVAFELTLRLAREGRPLPSHLVAMACRAPHRPDPDPPVAELPEDEFRRELIRIGGTPPEVLEHEELMELFAPILRADFALHETYLAENPAPLPVPLTVIGGAQDPKARREDVAAWKDLAGASYDELWLEEGHFFLTSAAPAVRDRVMTSLGLAGSR